MIGLNEQLETEKIVQRELNTKDFSITINKDGQLVLTKGKETRLLTSRYNMYLTEFYALVKDFTGVDVAKIKRQMQLEKRSKKRNGSRF